MKEREDEETDLAESPESVIRCSTHDVAIVRCEYKGGGLPLPTGKGLIVAQEVTEINV